MLKAGVRMKGKQGGKYKELRSAEPEGTGQFASEYDS